MKAQFEYQLPVLNESKFGSHGFCVVQFKNSPGSAPAICTYNMYGATYYDLETGDASYSSRDFLVEHYEIIDEPNELTLTLRK